MKKYDYEEIKALMEKRLTPERYTHSLNVAQRARELAEHYGEDTERAYFAGLVHDSTKNIPFDEQLQIIKNGGIILTREEKTNTLLYHAISGSVYARDVLCCDDNEVVSAIRYHTTGRESMTLLEKIIYIADYVSDERSFPGVDFMRELAFEDLDKACLYAVDFGIPNLIKRRVVLHPDTIALYNELMLKNVSIPEQEVEKNDK